MKRGARMRLPIFHRRRILSSFDSIGLSVVIVCPEGSAVVPAP